MPAEPAAVDSFAFDGDLPSPIGEERRFFDECQQDRLMLQWCGECSTHVFYPRTLCPKCWSSDLEWVEAGGRGHVFTFTVQERGPGGPAAPYVIAIIELEEGVRMMSRVITDSNAVEIGQPVRVAFATINDDGFKVPVFVPAGAVNG